MKIIELIKPRERRTQDEYGNEKVNKIIKEKGVFYGFNVRADYRVWFNNNCNKDIVIAYYKEEFVTIVLCKKGKKDYRGFTFVENSSLPLRDGYSNFDIVVADGTYFGNQMGKIVKLLERVGDKAIIVDKEEYDRARRLVILNSIEEQNG
jgi:hypothetical protein